MSFYFGDYTSKLKSNEEVAFYVVTIIMSNGDEVFSKVTEIESGVYLLNNPLRVVREYHGDGKLYTINFDMFNPFTDDSFHIIKEKDIISMSSLGKQYVKMYVEAIETYSNHYSAKEPKQELEWDNENDEEVSHEETLDNTRTLH